MPERKPSTFRERLVRWLSPARQPAKNSMARLYGGARMTNTTFGFGSGGSTSADAELATSLPRLRARSRQMIRDSAYAKRAQAVVVNNVVGAGVGMQAQVSTTRGNLNTGINDGIEAAWSDWAAADSCHTGGTLHFNDMERLLLGEVFAAGRVLVRKHYTPFGRSAVPLSLEVIESERLADEMVDVGSLDGVRGEIRMGVEVDQFQRPVAYWIRRSHPGDTRSYIADGARYERVPAADIFDLRVVTRWPQTAGEPWMHAVLRKLDDLNEYSQHEVTAARASAAYFGTISQDPDTEPEATDANGTPEMNIEPLTVLQMNAGEKFDFHSPNRPNSALDGFMRAMLREIAAGCGTSYESLSRDYSQSNYSSSRLSLIDDRDLWRTLQQWWLRSFRLPLHQQWLQQAVLAGAVQGLSRGAYAVDPRKFEAVTFKPRGWSWIDPTKEVNAYKEAIKAGFTTITDVIAQTAGGLDIEDVIATRRRELNLLEAAEIEVDTTVPEGGVNPANGQPVQPVAGAVEPDKPEVQEDEQEPVQAERNLAAASDALLAAKSAQEAAHRVAERVAYVEGRLSADQAIRAAQEQAGHERVDALAARIADTEAVGLRRLERAADLLQGAVQVLEAAAKKANARPLYASLPVINAEEILAWARSQGFPTLMKPADLHVTVAYSQKPINGEDLPPMAAPLRVSGGFRAVSPLGDGGAVVLKFESDQLQARWRQYADAGASWDWDSYTPHVTLTYDATGVDLQKVQPYAGVIVLGAEKQEALNLNKKDEYIEAAAS